MPGVNPNAIEDALSRIEGRSAEVISEILETHLMPNGDEYRVLMNFLALMHVRIPSARESMNQGVDLICRHLLHSDLRSKGTWESRVEAARKAGFDLGEISSYDHMRNVLEDRRYSFVAEQNWQIKCMLELMEELTPCFAAREWSLAISRCGALISSDCPVSVRFTDPKGAMDSPGLMREDTEITFPLSRNVLLIGSWERFASKRLALGQSAVAFCNSITAKRARRFLFSSAREFCWLDDKSDMRFEFGPLTQPKSAQKALHDK